MQQLHDIAATGPGWARERAEMALAIIYTIKVQKMIMGVKLDMLMISL